MKKYNPSKIELKWQKKWDQDNAFKADDDSNKEKFYCLDMFPYPSSHGLHVGHPEGYTATDIISRYKRMNGFEVIHPMGWDAFGLPAENFAIKTGVHPKETTKQSIKTFKRQIKSLGFSYDWNREVATCNPNYYKWTQWIFLQLYKNKLAYKKNASVNWCEDCKTVLANEQVLDGKCERCKNNVEQKDLEQWFFKTTDYAQRLLDDLKKLDWPEPIKLMQENWIGRSEGSELEFAIKNSEEKINVFTTRADTLYGATYMVLAPEHELIKKLKNKINNLDEIQEYINKAKNKSDLERTELQKEKTGVEIKGIKCINPVNNKEIPVYIADYVLASYGTGAIMAVPAHDERDHEFAEKYNIKIIPVIQPPKLMQDPGPAGIFGKTKPEIMHDCWCGPGTLINSAEFDGMDWQEAKKKITDKINGKLTINYKLRDWLISRQRYWGAPIPIIYCDKCGEVPVPEKQLPVELPDDVDFKPTGESPLIDSKSFHNVMCPNCGDPARREVDTMDTFVCSSWYFLRYCDPKNEELFADNEKLKQWMPVDLYVGGAEHACMHLIYARFFYKALKDLGFIRIDKKIDNDEPFQKLKNQGMILGEDQQKMSKSRGNVVNPDDVVKEYGADTLRMYEMFMGAFEDTKPWDTNSIKGIYRFLDKVWKLQDRIADFANDSELHEVILHKTIKKVTEDIESFGFNTAISAMMIMVNEISKQDQIEKNIYKNLVILLAPFAPHMCEEIWMNLENNESIFKQEWPKYRIELVKDDEIELVVQVNGKVRDKITVAADVSEDEAKQKALASEKVKKFLDNQKPKKIIFVKGKLISIVV